jgi:hypothetical protein
VKEKAQVAAKAKATKAREKLTNVFNNKNKKK